MGKNGGTSVGGLIAVYAALLALLAITVAAARFALGPVGLLIALTIAGAKALLVMWYFMEVRAASRVTWLFVGAGFVWFSIMLGLTFSEYTGRSRGGRAEPLSRVQWRGMHFALPPPFQFR